MRALITGITGQDGSYLADRLLAEGVEVHGLVRDSDPARAELEERDPAVVLHVADLGDTVATSALVAEVEPDEIYHLGGISSVAFSWQEPVATGLITGISTAALLDAAHRLGGARVVIAASSEIFGSPPHTPQSEATPIDPSSPYGAAKAYSHHMAGIMRARGLHASSCILYNHESPRRPEVFVTRKITAAAARIAAGQQEFLTLGALDVRRDWGWAPDYVDAMVRAVRHESPDDFVIATGVSHTVREFVARAFATVGIEDWESVVRVDDSLIRSAEIAEMRGDASKARAVLGWESTVGFDEVVARMVAHDVELAAAAA